MKSLLLAGAMVLGTAARAFIHFGTDLEPRINGPYYLVQVRSITESAHLAVPDLPLIFWLQAAVAKLIQFFVSAEPERAVLLACKAVDCVAPVLLVIPVHWFLGQWRSASAGVLTIAAALALAVVHPPLLSMTSEFEKNALGLVWFAAFAVSMRKALMEPSRVAATGVLCFSALAGLTHIGVFGATLLFTALAFTAGIGLLPDRRSWLIRLGLVSLCVSSLVLVIVARYFDPHRGEQLAHAMLPRVEAAVSAAPLTPDAVSHAVQPARQAAPHGASLVAALVFTVIVPVVLIHAAAIGALLVLWRRRRELPPGERVFVAATAVTALVLAWPFVVSDLAVRLQMIGVVPLVLLIPFVFSHWRSRRGVQIAATAVLAITVGSLWFTLGWNTEPTIPEDSLAELKSLRTSIAAPAETLIIAPWT